MPSRATHKTGRASYLTRSPGFTGKATSAYRVSEPHVCRHTAHRKTPTADRLLPLSILSTLILATSFVLEFTLCVPSSVSSSPVTCKSPPPPLHLLAGLTVPWRLDMCPHPFDRIAVTQTRALTVFLSSPCSPCLQIPYQQVAKAGDFPRPRRANCPELPAG